MLLQTIGPPKEKAIMDYVVDLLPLALAIAAFILIGLPLLRRLYGKLRGKKPLTESDANRWKNEPRVTSILLKSNESYSEMKRVDVAAGEFLTDPFDKKRKKKDKAEIYSGLPARTVTLTGDIFPTRLSRFIYGILFPFGLRMRLYHQLYNEPCTRDLFSGNVLLPDKKHKTLIEKGVIDEAGYLLDKGQRLVLQGCYVKPDFSDVDFIKSEFHAYKQSEAVVETAKAMRKTGQQFDRWFFYVLLGGFVAIVLVVFIMSGVGP